MLFILEVAARPLLFSATYKKDDSLSYIMGLNGSCL